MRQPCAVKTSSKGVVRMQGLHTHQGVGDHGDSIGGHEGDIIRRAAESQGVVGQ